MREECVNTSAGVRAPSRSDQLFGLERLEGYLIARAGVTLAALRVQRTEGNAILGIPGRDRTKERILDR
jgi:hypothetical protein